MSARYAARPALLLAFLALLVGPATAQTWPAPYDLNQGDYTLTAWPENSPAGTYPAHMRFHRGPGQDPAPGAEPNADYTGSYSSASGPRMNGMDNEGFSFLNTGTGGDLGAAVLALNTTGLQNVQVSWTGGTVAAAQRPYVIRLQYRVGTSGAFTDVPGPIEYAAAAAGHSESFATTLPSEVNDQPVVYVRWRYAQDGSGSGARPRLRVDDIAVTTSDSPSSGTGTVAAEPSILQGGQPHTLGFVVTAQSDDAGDRLTHVDLTLPESFGAISAEDVDLSPAGGTVEVVGGRLVRISGADISQSTPLRISIGGLAVPDVSGAFTFGVRTGAGSAQTVAIALQPQLHVWGTPEPIAQVKANDSQGVAKRLGDWVTVRGVVTVSDQFQTGGGEIGPSYLEDASGGMAVFSSEGVSARVEIGDEVVLMGRVDQFFGLNQLDGRTVVAKTIATGGTAEPTVVTLAQLASDGAGGVEKWEGRLVRVNGVTVNTSRWNAEGAGTNYQLSDGTATLDIRVGGAVDFAGKQAPSGPFDVIGVVSQFRPSPPNIGGYQLMPRFSADIIDDSSAPAITSAAPFEQAATPTSVTLSWTTSRAAHSEVRYVSYSSGEAGAVVDAAPKLQHTVTLTDLDPATVYTVEIRSAVGEDTTRITDYPVVTRAPEGTTHAIEVIFTGSVDQSLALYTPATSGSPVPTLLDRIGAAQHSIDIALYSLSGSTGSALASALIAAHQRGVAVRVVMEEANSSTAPPTALKNAGVPFITDTFGSLNDGQALHHNKFGVFDAYAEAPGAAWVFNGSWNATDPGTQQHKQNVVLIQDASVAAAFTREFDQLWGSRTTTPSSASARFGARKQLVAPTVFWIGDTRARLFFSPQGFGAYGSTEQQIIRALESAQHEIYLGLNLITRTSYVDAMRARFDEGVTVRGAIGEITTTGSVFGPLAAWADVHEYSASKYGLLHHKYALVDAEHPSANPLTITGSHNWSRSANEANDENTLLLYSADVTNQFLQEFAVRYREAGGEGAFDVSVEGLPEPGELVFSLSGNYPNPFATTTTFQYALGAPSAVSVSVYDVLGREVARVLDAEQPAGAYGVTFDASHLPSGVYLYRVDAVSAGRHFSDSGRMVIVR